MDQQRFDEWTRRLATSQSRRRALGMIVAAATGALQSQLSLAKNRKKKRKDKKKDRDREKDCPQGEEQCNGKCHEKCTGNRQRDRGTCACECIRTSCSGGMEYDFKICQCKCTPGLQKCDDGICIGTDKCCNGFKKCGGECIIKELCCPHTHRECGLGECIEKKFGICCSDVEEVECSTAPDGCCDKLAGLVCSDDGCCNTFAGEAVCDGKCIDVQSDPDNCGHCGVACGCGGGCVDGQCVGGELCGRCEKCENGSCVNNCAQGSGVCCGGEMCCPNGTCCVGRPGSRVPIACCEGTAGCCGAGGDGSATCSTSFCPKATSDDVVDRKPKRSRSDRRKD